MECLFHDIALRIGETANLTVYSDLHKDSAHADNRKIKKHMDARAALPNALFMANGDIFDNILPSDLKRHMPSAVDPRFSGFDAQIDERIQAVVDDLKAYPWVMVGMGNHCLSVLKRHYTNPAERLAQMLGVKYGGYSGLLRIRLFDPTRKKSRSPRNTVTVLYHHGAWGGQSKGIIGAKRFASSFEGWDVMTYGHNHQCNAHHETVLRMTGKGRLAERDRYIVNSGAFLRSLADGGSPSYSEVRGYAPVALAAPLIKITQGSDKPSISVSVGDC